MHRHRNFYAWRLLAAAQEEEGRSHLRTTRDRFRKSFDALEDLTDNEFRNRYRLSKSAFVALAEELRRYTDLKASQRVSLELKVLTALFFYATGSYQRPVGVAKHLSQKMCSVYIQQVTQALVHTEIIKRYIRFPSTPEERRQVMQKFYTKFQLPGVVGAVDGSHFHIFKPPIEEHLYFCRKQHHSLNVQMVCDSEYRILNVNPKFGGANHDSFVWENSQLNQYMQSLHQNNETVWLLGDSGYSQRPWLMVPYLNVRDGSQEALYNDKHIAARVVIENTFGRIKNRWRCLSKDRVLHYKPTKCAQIILACSVLHNIALDFGVPEPENLEDIQREQIIEEIYREPAGNATNDLIRGRHIMRDLLARRLHYIF